MKLWDMLVGLMNFSNCFISPVDVGTLQTFSISNKVKLATKWLSMEFPTGWFL